jgi:transposase
MRSPRSSSRRPRRFGKRVKQADADEGRDARGLTTAERTELSRLRREVRRLKVEREILSKAAAWFARESDSIPGGDSNS